MFKLTSRIKLFLVIIAFGIFTGLMFTYGYGILEGRNQALVDTIDKINLELRLLKKEQLTFEQGKKDIATLSQKKFPPQELFSKDTKVVKEITILEGLAKNFNLKFILQVSGTAKTATKVPGVSGDLYLVPYTVTLEGNFNDIQKYIESAEHTSFINQTQSIAVTAIADGKTHAMLYSAFYLKP